MRRFRRILYLFDRPPEHDAALDRAVDIARDAGATLTLAALVETGDAAAVEATRAALAKLAERLRRGGGRADQPTAGELAAIDCRVLTGEPDVAVVRAVLRDGYDLVMKKAGPDGGLVERLLGSLDTRLVEICPCPVWIDRPIPHPRYSRILAAVEVLAEEGAELHVTIVDLASSVAAFERAELFVVTAFEIEGETAMRGRAATQAARRSIDELVDRERRRHELALEALVAPFRDRPVSIHTRVLKGDPVRVVPEAARELEIDLVVLGTTIRSHLAGVLLGSTATAIIRSVACAVLVVKPPTFETPIRLEDDR
ncbi:Universal stress protein E [bacterium HR40]|nr:Universal stress protein E [bacterium HR40]